jgi:hypothetical protein
MDVVVLPRQALSDDIRNEAVNHGILGDHLHADIRFADGISRITDAFIFSQSLGYTPDGVCILDPHVGYHNQPNRVRLAMALARSPARETVDAVTLAARRCSQAAGNLRAWHAYLDEQVDNGDVGLSILVITR